MRWGKSGFVWWLTGDSLGDNVLGWIGYRIDFQYFGYWHDIWDIDYVNYFLLNYLTTSYCTVS